MLRKAVIPVGWAGQDVWGSSGEVPVELMPILDRPAIYHVVDEALASGAEEIILLGGPCVRMMEDYCREAPVGEGLWADEAEGARLQRLCDRCDILVVPPDQTASMGQALLRACAALNQAPFAWLQPDLLIDSARPCLAQLAPHYHGGTLVAVHPADAPDADLLPWLQTHPDDPHRVTDLAWEETGDRDGHDLALTGRHILHPDVLAALAEVPPGPGDILSALRLMAHAGGVSCRRFVGSPLSLQTAHGLMGADLALADRLGAMGSSPVLARVGG